MAKGFSRLVVATVVVTAMVAAGQTNSGEGDDAGSVTSPSDGSAPTSAQAIPERGPDSEPVPGQREKDQEAAPVELVPDPVDDECVLTAGEAQALIGEPVERTIRTSVPGPDGRPNPGCVAVRGENQLVLMNVYGVRGGSPADAVRRPAEGRRPLDGVGDAAAVIPARTGPALQVAGDRFVITIAAGFEEPSDDAWRAAGRAALDRVE